MKGKKAYNLADIVAAAGPVSDRCELLPGRCLTWWETYLYAHLWVPFRVTGCVGWKQVGRL